MLLFTIIALLLSTLVSAAPMSLPVGLRNFTSPFKSHSTNLTVLEAKNFGVSYLPYNKGKCLDSVDIAGDIGRMANYKQIRLAENKCNVLKIALQKRTPEQEIFIGIIDLARTNTTVAQYKRIIGNLTGVSVIIGNQGSTLKAQEIADLVGQSKAVLGPNIKVGPFASHFTYTTSPERCSQGDFIAIDATPFKNVLTPQNCGNFVNQAVSLVQTYCPNKPILVAQAGWPTSGNVNATVANRDICIEAMKNDPGAASKAILYSLYDQPSLPKKSFPKYGPFWGLGPIASKPLIEKRLVDPSWSKPHAVIPKGLLQHNITQLSLDLDAHYGLYPSPYGNSTKPTRHFFGLQTIA